MIKVTFSKWLTLRHKIKDIEIIAKIQQYHRSMWTTASSMTYRPVFNRKSEIKLKSNPNRLTNAHKLRKCLQNSHSRDKSLVKFHGNIFSDTPDRNIAVIFAERQKLPNQSRPSKQFSSFLAFHEKSAEFEVKKCAISDEINGNTRNCSIFWQRALIMAARKAKQRKRDATSTDKHRGGGKYVRATNISLWIKLLATQT